jgi:hypothetical protein
MLSVGFLLLEPSVEGLTKLNKLSVRANPSLSAVGLAALRERFVLW